MTAKSAPAQDTWVWDPLQGVYYQSLTSTYAIPDPTTGQWSYISSAEFYPAESSTSSQVPASVNPSNSKEDGEIDDDVGWGGLMEPEQLAAVVSGKSLVSTTQITKEKKERHPAYGAYDDPAIYAYPAEPDDPPNKLMPDHLLRLVVTRSESLVVGQVAVIDAREDGVQIGRDRCEKGAQARVRVKEMEASKTHAVIYWGKGSSNKYEDEEEGWWIVDLGSTHGTFVDPRTSEKVENPVKPKRLSEPKHASKPYPLHHLAKITIAGTTFTSHIHPQWPCDHCQLTGDNEIPLDTGPSTSKPAPLPEVTGAAGPSKNWAMDSKEKRENREIKRKREMASLRENLLKSREPPQVTTASPKDQETAYLDRSAIRRRLHPPSPPRQSPPSSAPTPPSIPVIQAPAGISAIAQNMLASQGWTPGQGLGKGGEGRSEPVVSEMRDGKKGLGAKGSLAVVDAGPGDWRERGKFRRWESQNGS